jgi:hypothetical protein
MQRMRASACTGARRREEPSPGFGREPDDERTAERRAIVALLAAATILYGGVIPGEIIWKTAPLRGSGASGQKFHPVRR